MWKELKVVHHSLETHQAVDCNRSGEISRPATS
jgi:hypothetical protein